MILDNEARRTFAQADVNTIIALLGPPDDQRLAGLDKTARFVMFKVPFEEVLSPVVFQEIEEATDRVARPEFRVIARQQRDLHEEGLAVGKKDEVRKAAARYQSNKWGGKYLRAPEIFLTVLEKGKGKLVRMKDIAEVQRGFTTGANDFFYVRVIAEEAPGVVRVVCDDGSEHLLEAEYVCEPVMVKAREIVRPAMSAADLRYCLVRLDEAAARKRHTNAYITWGETKGFHNRPTTRGRRPWYAIRVQDYAAIAFPLAHKRRPVLALLQDKFHLDKRLCAIYPHHSGDALLIAASLLGTFSTLGREVYGRANFGQGLLELAVYEVANLEILDPRCLTAKDKAALTAAFYQLSERDILMLYDDVRCADRVALDDAFLEAVGFTDVAERSALVKELHDAACRMIWKRMAKAGNARESRQTYNDWLASGKPFGLDVEEE
jgi:hypothetical protein